MKLVITGASGYLGGQFLKACSTAGFDVICLSSSVTSMRNTQNISFKHWIMGEGVSKEILAGADVFIHFAHIWDQVSDDCPLEMDLNLLGAVRLLENVIDSSCKRFIYVSTTAAHSSALNRYGKVKYLTEDLLRNLNSEKLIIAKIGFIYGGDEKGLFGLLSKLVKIYPIMPLVGKNIMLQPIHIGEVVAGLLKLSTIRLPKTKFIVLASEKQVSFGDYLKVLRFGLTGKSIFFIPINLNAVLVLSRLLSLIPFAPQVSAERIYGLVGAKCISTDSNKPLNLEIKDPVIEISNIKNLRRSILIRESCSYLSYIGIYKPSVYVRRLTRAYEKNGEAVPEMRVGSAVYWWFIRLYFTDIFQRRGLTSVKKRLNAAIRYAEVCSLPVLKQKKLIFIFILFDIVFCPVACLIKAMKK